MTRRKLKHFAEMKKWSHVFEPDWGQDSGLVGTWKKGEGGASESERLVLELACGKGYYTLALAERQPESVVVGVDIKGSRIWHGGKEAMARGLQNAKFLRTRIEDLTKHFAPGEVDEIWITFPDPHPREGKEKKRLTSPRFLEIYRQVLSQGGLVHLKTDDDALFDYTLEVLLDEGLEPEIIIRDVYSEQSVPEILHVQTQYEQKFLARGRKIKYLCAAI
jgi:tRNA (guanine-N7-)-methyltransferase